jgi:hypothetical protein
MAFSRKHKRPAALVAALIGSVAAAAHATSVDLSKEGPAREFARQSEAPMADGNQECQEIAEWYPTLGAAFRWHEKRANVENSFHCRQGPHGWTCKASFAFNDKKESERDWALFLKFSVDESGKVSRLRCEAAG